jgi:hypothetical protein
MNRVISDYQKLAILCDLIADDDVVNGNVDKLDEEASETHEHEADAEGEGGLEEFCR